MTLVSTYRRQAAMVRLDVVAYLALTAGLRTIAIFYEVHLVDHHYNF